MDLSNRKGDKNKEKKQKTPENVLRKPVDSDRIHSEVVPEQEADQQEELQAEPGRESKGTKDDLKRFEQKLDLILDRILNAEENLEQRISAVEENPNE